MAAAFFLCFVYTLVRCLCDKGLSERGKEFEMIYRGYEIKECEDGQYDVYDANGEFEQSFFSENDAMNAIDAWKRSDFDEIR